MPQPNVAKSIAPTQDLEYGDDPLPEDISLIESSPSSKARLIPSVLGLALILLLSFAVRLKLIEGSLPYPVHNDELVLTLSAIQIIQTGDLNPNFFRYPSLPVYLTAAGMGFGFLRACAELQIRKTSEIGRVVYPYYETEIVMGTARAVFAALSILGLLCVALLSWKLWRHRAYLLLPTALLTCSPLYLKQSWIYVNPNIVGTVAVLGVVTWWAFNHESESIWRRVLIPGLLSGAAAASKYNFGVVALCPIVWIMIGDRDRKLSDISLLVLFSFIGFLICMPYALLDISGFLDGLGWEVYHYQQGHRGRAYGPLAQVNNYVGVLSREFGTAVFFLGVLGFFALFAWNWRYALAVHAFPITYLLLMTQQRVFFSRAALVLLPFLVLYASWMFVTTLGYLWGLRHTVRDSNQVIRLAPPAVGMGLLLWVGFTLPIERVIADMNRPVDSRTLFVEWAQRNVQPGSTIYVPEELWLDTRGLEKFATIKSFSVGAIEGRVRRELSPSLGDYILAPEIIFQRNYPDSAERVKSINERLSRLNPIEHFGSNGVRLLGHHRVPVGDPAFSVSQIE